MGHGYLGAVKQGLGPQLEPPAPQPLREEPCALQHTLRRSLAAWMQVPVSGVGGPALEGLRKALCAACVEAPHVHEATQWACEELERQHEELPIAHWAACKAASEWAREHWTPHWLCGDAEPRETPSVLYRRSDVLLLEMEFRSDVRPSDPVSAASWGFLVCAACELPAFQKDGIVWGHSVSFDDESGADCWSDQVRAATAADAGSGLTVLSFTSVPVYEHCPVGFLSRKAFSSQRRAHLQLQDAVLTTACLWSRRSPFAVAIPCADPVIHATLCRLPGIVVFRGVRGTVLYNCQVDAIPGCLFHFVN